MSFVYAVTVSQFGFLFTGIRGFTLFFIIGHAIMISLGLLLYEGRRWRFFLQSVLVALLFIPTHESGIPFDVLARMPIIINAFIGDLTFNTIYPFFKKRNKLVFWTMLIAPIYFIIGPYLSVLNYYLFYPPQIADALFTVFTLMLPITIIESIAGGFLGYKIYKRIESV